MEQEMITRNVQELAREMRRDIARWEVERANAKAANVPELVVIIEGWTSAANRLATEVEQFNAQRS